MELGGSNGRRASAHRGAPALAGPCRRPQGPHAAAESCDGWTAAGRELHPHTTSVLCSAGAFPPPEPLAPPERIRQRSGGDQQVRPGCRRAAAACCSPSDHLRCQFAFAVQFPFPHCPCQCPGSGRRWLSRWRRVSGCGDCQPASNVPLRVPVAACILRLRLAPLPKCSLPWAPITSCCRQASGVPGRALYRKSGWSELCAAPQAAAAAAALRRQRCHRRTAAAAPACKRDAVGAGAAGRPCGRAELAERGGCGAHRLWRLAPGGGAREGGLAGLLPLCWPTRCAFCLQPAARLACDASVPPLPPTAARQSGFLDLSRRVGLDWVLEAHPAGGVSTELELGAT